MFSLIEASTRAMLRFVFVAEPDEELEDELDDEPHALIATTHTSAADAALNRREGSNRVSFEETDWDGMRAS